MTLLFCFSAPHGTGMVESLAMKTATWECEKGIEFTYDGVRNKNLSFGPLFWYVTYISMRINLKITRRRVIIQIVFHGNEGKGEGKEACPIYKFPVFAC